MSSYKPTTSESKGRYSGQVFMNQYHIDQLLGTGGIGEVYLARDSQLYFRQVVIKVLLEDSATDPWLSKKFRQEIEALSKINHPGIVDIMDSGQTPDGKPFLVMQYVKGTNLRSLINPQGMPFRQVAAIMRQVTLAVGAAHDLGIIHCDLKPENIMLQDLGEGQYHAKIVDFGIAKMKNSQIDSPTLGTRVAGSAYYMSPEQILGQPVPATDVFALGVIAYEMLTGWRPYNPPTVYQVIETIRAGVKFKPTDVRPDLPIAAEQIVLKAISPDSVERYQRARDFGELLAQALTSDLELPATNNAVVNTELEMAHVLFMDIVGYSKLPTDEQKQIITILQTVVLNSPMFQRAKAAKSVIGRPTGDGMALVFFSQVKIAVESGVEIFREVRQLPRLKLRMGLNSGPVYRVTDINEAVDVAGAGINIAQRVMDCGDAGHILLSKSVADVIGELSEWRDRIRDLGDCKVKHDVTVHLYNLTFEGVGNPELPQKLRRRKPSGRSVKIGLAAAAVVALAVLLVAVAPRLAFWPSASRYLEEGKTAFTHNAYQAAIARLNEAITRGGVDAEAYYYRGRAKASLNLAQEAIDDYNRAISLKSNYFEAFRFRGDAYRTLNDKKQEEDDIRSSLTFAAEEIHLNPKNARAYWVRGTSYLHQLKYDEAFTDFSEAIKVDPNFASAYEGRGRVHSLRKEYDQALKDYDQAIRLDPDYAHAYYHRCNTFANQQKYDEAIKDCSNASNLDPYIADAHFKLGDVYEKQNQPDKAIREYGDAIRLAPNLASAYENRCGLFKRQKKYDEAIKDCNEAIRLDPNDEIAHLQRGNVYQEQGNYDQAIKDYSEAIRLAPDSSTVYQIRGTFYDEQHKYAEALKDCNEAVRLDPKSANAYVLRGRVYASLVKADEAARDYTEAIRLEPNNASHYAVRGIIYFFQKKYDEAIKDCSEAIRLDPKDSDAYMYRGRAYAGQQKYNLAIDDLSKAIELDQKDARYYENRANVYEKMGLKDKAQADRQKAKSQTNSK